MVRQIVWAVNTPTANDASTAEIRTIDAVTATPEIFRMLPQGHSAAFMLAPSAILIFPDYRRITTPQEQFDIECLDTFFGLGIFGNQSSARHHPRGPR
jgi:hypothetical protein